jgi:hypothetical protein
MFAGARVGRSNIVFLKEHQMIDGALTTGKILDIFTKEIQNRQGRVSDTFHDGRRLFVRSLLPYVADVRPKDRMQGGVALRATEDELWLHPYLFREICRNGAVMAQAIESLHVECLGVYTPDEGSAMLRDAIDRCAEKGVFARSMQDVRSSATLAMDWLNLIPHLTYFQSTGLMGRFLGQILERFESGADRSGFGLMNAVTSLARDTRDPDDRWRLEELGGGIGALVLPKPSDSPAHAASDRRLVPV